MKTKIRSLILTACITTLPWIGKTETVERNLPVFTEISLRIPAKLFIEQGVVQNVTIDARASTLEKIITEINDRTLIIRFPTKNYFIKNFDPGKITIHVTIPEITGLNLSGSGEIIAEEKLSTLIMDLSVSGSGNVNLEELNAERVKSNVSGSGNIIIRSGKTVSDFSGSISGSGNIKAENLEARDVKITIAGSGNCSIRSDGNMNVKIAGSGNVYYNGNPNIDSTIAGSGSIKEIR